MEKTRRSGCRVTAVVVTYNRKELLAECLQALLAQTVFDTGAGCELEILVVDNASTDGKNEAYQP